MLPDLDPSLELLKSLCVLLDESHEFLLGERSVRHGHPTTIAALATAAQHLMPRR